MIYWVFYPRSTHPGFDWFITFLTGRVAFPRNLLMVGRLLANLSLISNSIISAGSVSNSKAELQIRNDILGILSFQF
jgi:hypothetical protein